jgi:small-conductance mechanosensitive channel
LPVVCGLVSDCRAILEGVRTAVLTVRDFSRRPHLTWRDAWAQSRNHDLSTFSTWAYVRETKKLGGLRALTPALLVSALGVVLIIAAAFGASVLATAATGPTAHAWLIILLSVVLAQVIGSVQARKLPRRTVIAANERVRSTPPGVQITDIEVYAEQAPALAAVLLANDFLYVEITYYRNDRFATLSAYFMRDKGHGHELVARALGSVWHRVGNIYEL